MNRGLLEERAEGGYPAEYVVSRIRGRRGALISDWEPFLADAASLESLRPWHSGGSLPEADIWSLLLAEYRWVYLQMDKSLRDIFRPFFLYSGLRTLFFCLRFRASGETVKMEQVLGGSLFSKQFRKALLNSVDLPSMFKTVERFFEVLSPGFRGLAELYERDGWKGAEVRLTNRYLEHVLSSPVHPVMKELFVRLVDARNVLALFKHLRWEMKIPPLFAEGGSIRLSRLRSVLETADLFALTPLLRTVTGLQTKEAPDPSVIENTLYRGMSRFLRKKGRELSGVGLILEYLWKCSLEAVNIGTILRGTEMDRDALREELLL